MTTKIHQAIIALLAVTIPVAGYLGYDYGRSVANSNCKDALYTLQNGVNKSNIKELEVIGQQRSSYRNALEIRNKQYTKINKAYNAKITELEKARNESQDTCINALIPDDFK